MFKWFKKTTLVRQFTFEECGAINVWLDQIATDQSRSKEYKLWEYISSIVSDIKTIRSDGLRYVLVVNGTLDIKIVLKKKRYKTLLFFL